MTTLRYLQLIADLRGITIGGALDDIVTQLQLDAVPVGVHSVRACAIIEYRFLNQKGNKLKNHKTQA